MSSNNFSLFRQQNDESLQLSVSNLNDWTLRNKLTVYAIDRLPETVGATDGEIDGHDVIGWNEGSSLGSKYGTYYALTKFQLLNFEFEI